MNKYEKALKFLVDYAKPRYKFKNAISTLEKLVVPPTEKEVCEALSDYLGENVLFDRVIRMFIYYPNKFITTSNKGYNIYSIQMTLPPHLITLIGRFYEGLINND